MKNILINGYLIHWAKAEAHGQLANQESDSEGKSKEPDAERASTIKTIEAKQLTLLKVLYQAQGDIVSQETLLDLVWPDSVVTANTVQQTIAQLRKTLGDDGRAQKAIKTHPKLGYSLCYEYPDETISPSVTTGKSVNYSKPLPIRFIGLALLCVFALLILQFILSTAPAKKAQPSLPNQLFTEFKPITVNGEVVRSAAYNQVNQNIYFAVDKNNSTEFVVQPWGQTDRETLLSDVAFYGQLAISPTGQTLLYSKIELQPKADNKKCIDLYTLPLQKQQDNQAETRLTHCELGFSHSAKWLNRHEILLLNRDQKFNNQLYHFNLNTQKIQKVALPYPHIIDFDLSQNKLVLLTNDHVVSFVLTDATTPYKAYEVKRPSNTSLAKVRWYNTNQVILLGEQTLTLAFGSDQWQPTPLNLLSNSQLLDLTKGKDNQYLAITGSNNWDVSLRELQTKIDTPIGSSLMLEAKGQFRPHTQAISFISQRTGTKQVWQQVNDSLTQLTYSKAGIRDYIWQSKGQGLFFISADKLWFQDSQNRVSEMTVAFEPVQFFQVGEHHLLLSARLHNTVNDNADNKPSLIWFDYQQDHITVLANEEVNWAQRLDQDTFISNDEFGKLTLYQGESATAIKEFADVTLQWRYFWRADNEGNYALYFQDKAQNIWRYQQRDNTAHVIAEYDENALFMTDFSATTQRMLSDVFIAEKRELIQLSHSNIKD